MKYFYLAATSAASASALSSYQEYVADDVKPVCGKHYDQNRNRLCNLFLSCHFDKFQAGRTGQKWCPEACAKFDTCFPREMCKADHWIPAQADKFEIEEDNNQVCYTKNDQIGRQCVAVQGFCDIGGAAQVSPDVVGTDQAIWLERITAAGAHPCDHPGCMSITLFWSNEGDLKNDLDLYVDGPEGRLISDSDAMEDTINAVENVAYASGLFLGTPPKGKYTVGVENVLHRNYANRDQGSKNYTVAIRIDGGEIQIFDRSTSEEKEDFITTFTY